MPYLREGPRLLSRPIGVQWAGWTTDTLRLQRCGWDLAVEHDFYRDGYALLMRHEQMKMHAYTDQVYMERALQDPRYFGDNFPTFTVRHVAATFQCMRTAMDFSRFRQIDAEPQIVDTRIESVEDLNIFAMSRQKSKEILVNQADMTVIEHLEAIQRLQDPKQHEIRQRMLRERETTVPVRGAPRLKLVANLVHLEEAA